MRTAIRFAIASERVRADVIEASQFPQLVKRYQVFAVPKVVINGADSFEGALPDEQFLGRIEQALLQAAQQSEQP